MANTAKRDAANRTVEVDRLDLISQLKKNRDKHKKDYDEAMAGYKSILLSKIDDAFDSAKKKLVKLHSDTKDRVSKFTDEDISRQSDYFSVIDAVSITMKVPRSYEKEYDAAIDMATWDVNKTLELTNAEFTCFVRDQWDWSSDFENISAMYKMRG